MNLTSIRRATVTFGVALATLTAGAPAQASDASLRKVIRTQERKVDVAAEAFAKTTEEVESAVGRERATTAVGKLKTAVSRLRTAAAKEKATTAKVKRGRTQYLAALTSFSTGLKTFEQGIEAFDPDAPAKAEVLFKRSAAQLKSATTRRDKAAKLIGGLST